MAHSLWKSLHITHSRSCVSDPDATETTIFSVESSHKRPKINSRYGVLTFEEFLTQRRTQIAKAVELIIVHAGFLFLAIDLRLLWPESFRFVSIQRCQNLLQIEGCLQPVPLTFP